MLLFRKQYLCWLRYFREYFGQGWHIKCKISNTHFWICQFVRQFYAHSVGINFNFRMMNWTMKQCLVWKTITEILAAVCWNCHNYRIKNEWKYRQKNSVQQSQVKFLNLNVLNDWIWQQKNHHQHQLVVRQQQPLIWGKTIKTNRRSPGNINTEKDEKRFDAKTYTWNLNFRYESTSNNLMKKIYFYLLNNYKKR